MTVNKYYGRAISDKHVLQAQPSEKTKINNLWGRRDNFLLKL